MTSDLIHIFISNSVLSQLSLRFWRIIATRQATQKQPQNEIKILKKSIFWLFLVNFLTFKPKIDKNRYRLHNRLNLNIELLTEEMCNRESVLTSRTHSQYLQTSRQINHLPPFLKLLCLYSCKNIRPFIFRGRLSFCFLIIRGHYTPSDVISSTILFELFEKLSDLLSNYVWEGNWISVG